jgi:hypothetical protein
MDQSCRGERFVLFSDYPGVQSPKALQSRAPSLAGVFRTGFPALPEGRSCLTRLSDGRITPGRLIIVTVTFGHAVVIA